MIKLFLTIYSILLVTILSTAQDFITRGKIQYEIKKNTKRMFAGNTSDILSSLPEFDISNSELIFSWESSIYKQGRTSSIFSNQDPGAIYTDLSKKETVIQKTFFNDVYIYADSIKPIKWQITNETRKIIGFDCRKAIGRIYDSVYVVAFYAPEIIPQAGPEMFTGLPGMILGLAIPRYYTTWFATKLEVANIDEALITPPTTKKVKQTSKKEAVSTLWKKLKANNTTLKDEGEVEKNWMGGFLL